MLFPVSQSPFQSGDRDAESADDAEKSNAAMAARGSSVQRDEEGVFGGRQGMMRTVVGGYSVLHRPVVWRV
jgi:hypothetical protein